MSDFTFIARCPSCGAKNRVRLSTGRRVRIRCGRCGEQIGVDQRRMLLIVAWRKLRHFFGNTLPSVLLWAVDRVMRVLGGLFSPLGRAWGRLPWTVRKRMAWGALGVLAVYYFLIEGTVKFSSLLLLAVLLVLATLVIVVAARGPKALRELRDTFGGRVLKSCPNCGHRYFGLLKHCPNCGH